MPLLSKSDNASWNEESEDRYGDHVEALVDGVALPATGFIERFYQRYSRKFFDILLADHTTGNNIIWATDEYGELGKGYGFFDEIKYENITGSNSGVIKPRLAKKASSQLIRTRSHAEVSSPSWLVEQMNSHLDREWFGQDVFTVSTEHKWLPLLEPIQFSKKHGQGWQSYIQSPRLELTCGEAPFVCSRYDTVTGEQLQCIARVGFLDRKLRVAGENAKTQDDWHRWALEALKASFGYEYQGDSLLIARINVLETYVEHFYARWNDNPKEEDVERAAQVVAWNFWQMDGRSCSVPGIDLGSNDQLQLFPVISGEVSENSLQESLFKLEPEPTQEAPSGGLSKIYNWSNDSIVTFSSLLNRTTGEEDMNKFFAVIGNPPYQEDVEGNQRSVPIYSAFMDSAYQIANRVELITPARFLFNAGQTRKEWNQKMLADPHLEVLRYEPDASVVFPEQDIKGGVAVTYRDATRELGPIGIFIPDAEVRNVFKKVKSAEEPSIDTIFTGAVPYKFTNKVKQEHPELLSEIGSSFDLRTNILDKLDNTLFFSKRPADGDPVAIFGLVEKHRDFRWIDRSYIEVPDNFEHYKVLLPKAFGKGSFGEKLPEMVTVGPRVGHTQSFVSIGNFATEEEAQALEKYIKTKFARSLLGILKVTQDVTARVWAETPIQDFSPSSDIDWSKSISDIDRQLYIKYGLTIDEIDFIETHVQEME